MQTQTLFTRNSDEVVNNTAVVRHEVDGRVILKSVSGDYHGRKNKNQSEDH